MKTHVRVIAAIGALAMVAGGCGGGSDSAADIASESGTSPVAETTTSAADATTTTQETTTTEAPTTSTTEPTTTTAAVPEAPPAGTGILTIAGVDHPFTIEKCSTEPTIIGTSTFVFEMRGTATIDDQTVEARAVRSVHTTSGAESDTFGYGYATDRNDYTTAVSVGSEFGTGLLLKFADADGSLLVYAGPTQFERTEGITVVEDVDPVMGSIVATCTP